MINKKLAAILLGASLLVSITACGAQTNSTTEDSVTGVSTEEVSIVEEDNNTEENTDDSDKLVNANVDDINLILNELKQTKSSNCLIPVQVGTLKYMWYYYNDSNESLTEYTENAYEVITSENKAIRTDFNHEELAIGSDCDLLTMIENCVASADGENIKVYIDTEDTYTDSTMYIVELNGEDAIKKLWASVDESKVDWLYKQFLGEDTLDDINGKLFIKLQINTDKENNDEPLFTRLYYERDDQQYTIWYSYNVLEIEKWKLPDEWYEDLSQKDGDYVAEMMTDLVDDLREKVNSIDNGE